MNKQIVIPIIVLLAAGLILVGYLFSQERNKLADAQSEVVSLEGTVTNLEEKVSILEAALAEESNSRELAQAEIVTLAQTISGLEANVAALETTLAEEATKRELAQSEAVSLEGAVANLEENLSTLEANLENLQNALAAQQNINVTLSDQLRQVKYPRHFTSVEELTAWLQKDDTDTKDEPLIQHAFILQVRALMDGYLLPVSFYWHEGELWVVNRAVIGGNIYGVGVRDDRIELSFDGIELLPARPIPSG